MASKPTIRSLFHRDEFSPPVRLITDYSAEEIALAALAAECLCDAFESAIEADRLTRGKKTPDQFYEYYRDNMFTESAFMRSFVLSRPRQYNPLLTAIARRNEPVRNSDSSDSASGV
jgi:hypothetical protein